MGLPVTTASGSLKPSTGVPAKALRMNWFQMGAATTEPSAPAFISLPFASPTQTPATSDGDWLPLGVFALCKSDETKSNITVQLAVNRQGVVRGNYSDADAITSDTQVIQGSVDKQSQRVAFTIGDNKTNVIETGLYNLTEDEAPALIHFGKDRTEQWLLVRLKAESGSEGQSN